MKKLLIIIGTVIVSLFAGLYVWYLLDTMPAYTLTVEPTQMETQTIERPSLPAIDPERPTADYIKAYVILKAKVNGVDPVIADWIVDHESQYCYQQGYFNPGVAGDDGISIGCWQFNLNAHPDILRSCAEDLYCSTDLAMKWLKAGRQDEWTTWKYRHEWYVNAPY